MHGVPRSKSEYGPRDCSGYLPLPSVKMSLFEIMT